MEPQDLELRLQTFKEELQSGLDAMQHAQRMRSMSAGQQLEGALEQIRRDLATITSRTVSHAEFQQLRQAVEALGAASGQGGLGSEVLELLPRFMQELTRLREDAGSSAPRQAPPASQVQSLQARLDELGRQLTALAERGAPLRAQDLEARVHREAEERSRQIQALHSALEGLERKVAAPLPREVSSSASNSGASVELNPEEFQALRREMEAGMEAMRTAIPAAISELRRQLPPSRDWAPALENLKSRLEALEGQQNAPTSAPALEPLASRLEALEGRKHPDFTPVLEGLSQRLDVLEGRKHQDFASVLEGLANRLEALESGVTGEREHVREVFRDLLEEHDLLLRRLDSRLTLLVQDFHRLSEGQDAT